ncbi:PP2C family protein-serine/threonine phosphatase [Occallatibacter riparius]|uniref:Serine/threonine-protein phosphatase n=1 Tax=Occallatibacter riparius TaxID=1002689 RepID=A0A9J7BQN2_9BACT|nr:PP2C family protein-serine/threonine phosphatase [Occallatibacter riparius]UWZ84050.1 serine/threonine-protein phosphatase [Occallatibacter riparius]
MLLVEPQLTAGEVLRAFRHDEPFLILGAAFTTVSVIALGVCVIRRRFDALLVWLAVFASLYGIRLWMTSRILQMTIPPGAVYGRLIGVVNYLVPIPAFMFFRAAGFLGRFGRAVTLALLPVFALLVIATAVGDDRYIYQQVNSAVVIALILLMFVTLFQRKADRDFAVVRFGLMTFGVLAVLQNVAETFQLEAYGFAVLLACLGYVAVRKTAKRDEELTEIQRELDLARRMQLSLLPAGFPESMAFRVAARYEPMSSVAGDLYEFLVADGWRAGLLIADVSGHGVPAALIASMVKMAALSQREHAEHPGRVLTGMNRALIGSTQGQYVTAAYAHLDAERGEIRYAAAGHPAMLLLRDGEVSEVAENGLVLAAAEGIEYSEKAVTLRPGDRVVLYTDGIVEARDRAGKMFGDAALMEAVRESAGKSAEEVVAEVVERVLAWGASQEDDLTILVCDCVEAGKRDRE